MRTREGIHGVLEKGKCLNKAPRGYLNLKHELPDKVVVKEVIVDNKKAPVIKEIFAEVAKGTCTPSYIGENMPVMAL